MMVYDVRCTVCHLNVQFARVLSLHRPVNPSVQLYETERGMEEREKEREKERDRMMERE